MAAPRTPHPDPDESREEGGVLHRAAERFGLQAAQNWVGDFGRFWWALLALNLRKSLFVAGRRKGRCPCQNPSDSGKAWETGCDAIAGWSEPSRFSRICPKLRRSESGSWRCSVDTAAVRPFWGRAAGYFGGAAATGYLGATLAAFILLRLVGYPVHYRSIAWPGAWHQIREARGRYFFVKAEDALSSHNPGPAMLWLAQSYELDPANYSAGRILAQLLESAGSEYTNRLYRRLLNDHPEERTATSQAWFGALITHGDFATIENLAREQIAADPAHAGAWLNALLVANRRTGHPQVLSQVAGNPALPPWVRRTCSCEAQLREAGREEKRRILTQPVPPSEAAPYLLYHRIDRLLDAGMAGEALVQLNRVRGRFDTRDRLTLELDTYASLGWTSFLSDTVDQVLSSSLGPPLVELLASHLIRHPNPELLNQVCSVLEKRPLPPEPESASAYASLFCAAGAAEDWGNLARLAAQLQRVTGAPCPSLNVMEAYFRGECRTKPLERYLLALPILPIEVDYALFSFSDRRLSAPTPAATAARPTITAP